MATTERDTSTLPTTSATASSAPRAARSTDLRCEVIATVDALEALAPAWRALLTDRQTFVGPDWTIEWLRGPGAAWSPHVVAARDASGTLVGVLPLARRRGLLSTCGPTHGFAHGDVVAAPGRAADVAAAVVAHVAASASWRVRFHRCVEDGALAQAVRARRPHQVVLERFAAACPFLTPVRDWLGFLKDLSKHQRHEATRQLRRFWERDGAAIRWVTSPADVGPAMDVLFDLHTRRFDALGRDTALASPRLREFHGRLAARLAVHGGLVLGVLEDGGKPVAAAYGFSSGATTSFFNAGIDPAFSRTGAGVVLRCHVLKDATIEAGRTELDFLEGCQEWKLRWATGVRPLVDLDLFPAGAAGRAHGALRGLIRSLKARAGKALHGERPPGRTSEEPADPKHCRRIGCAHAPAAQPGDDDAVV